MPRILVWDIPTRLFHWLLAVAFVGAFAIAQLLDDDSPNFRLHMLLGLTAAFLVALRVVWGFVGSKHARFGDFAWSPKGLVDYLKGAFAGGGKRYAGHNPGSTWAIAAMFVAVLGLAATGIAMGQGNEAAKDVHEGFVLVMVLSVVAHLAGIVWHTVRHKEAIALSMVHGQRVADAEQAIRSAHPSVAVLFLVLVGLWGGALFTGYDAAKSEVALPGLGVLHLGEPGEGGAEGKRGSEAGEKHEDGGDDDD